MAPECLSGEDYNLKADVYTFAIVMWKMLAGGTPYSFVRNRDQLYYHVVEERGRPEIDKSWPTSIKGMLESSFDADIEKRPVSEKYLLCLGQCCSVFCSLPFSYFKDNATILQHHPKGVIILAGW